MYVFTLKNFSVSFFLPAFVIFELQILKLRSPFSFRSPKSNTRTSNFGSEFNLNLKLKLKLI